MRFRNHYRCECGSEWEDEYDCEVDDRCPECNTSISPYRSEDVGTRKELTCGPPKSKERHVLECDECGSESVRAEVWATMEPQTGRLVMADQNPGAAWCLDCDDYIGFSYTEKTLEIFPDTHVDPNGPTEVPA